MDFYLSRDHVTNPAVDPWYSVHREKPDFMPHNEKKYWKNGNQFVVGLTPELAEKIFGISLEPGQAAHISGDAKVKLIVAGKM